MLLVLRSGSGAAATGGGGAAFAVAAFEDLLADVLGGGLDFLHFFADAGPGGLVPADRLGHIFLSLCHQTLEGFIFRHHWMVSQKGRLGYGFATTTARQP